MHVTKHESGRFCWTDLSTTDGPGAKAFYSALMGWTPVDNPMGPDMIYTMLTLNGQSAGALYQDNSGKAPPHWDTYVSVDDADATAARAKELGGTIVVEPFDVAEHGRMGVIQDPTGAYFCIWQPKNHIGYTVIDEPGSVCWNELATRDTKAAEEFYCGLFGYTVKHSQMPMPYTELQVGGKPIGGMMAMGAEMEGVPPHWTVYWLVGNCQETFDKAKSLGASFIVEPMAIPTVGTMAMMQDPQGAVFAFIAP